MYVPRKVVFLILLMVIAPALAQQSSGSLGVRLLILSPEDAIPADAPPRTAAEVEAGMLPLIPNRQVLTQTDWTCTNVCIDRTGRVRGEVTLEMQAWLKNHPDLK